MSKKKLPMTIAMALRDDGMASCRIGADGRPVIGFPGQIRLPDSVTQKAATGGNTEWFPRTEDTGLSLAGSVLNTAGDFDDYSIALSQIDKRYDASTLFFNHPRVISQVRKDVLAEPLSGIEGLVVPRTIRVQATTPTSLQEAFEASGMAYPVTVQLTTETDNHAILVIGKAADWDRTLDLDWPRKWFYITDVSGVPLVQHTRFRLCYVGTALEFVRFAFAYPPRSLVANLPPSGNLSAAIFSSVCNGLASRVPLDYFSVELSVQPSGKARLEHLWVGLPFTDKPRAGDPSRRMWQKVGPKLEDLIRRPSDWRHARMIANTNSPQH